MIKAAPVLLCACVLGSGPASAQEQEKLYGACFTATYDARYLAEHPGQRIVGLSVGFQGFSGSLLASVSYKLRYGTRFGFSGECEPEPSGGFICKACGSEGCGTNPQTFKLKWDGGDRLDVVNDTTGLFAQNPAGGRDRLAAGGPHASFTLTRAAADACAP